MKNDFGMADHSYVPRMIDFEGHLIGPPNMDPRVDISDIFNLSSKVAQTSFMGSQVELQLE